MGKKAKNATYISGNEAGKISREVAKVEKRRIVKSTLCNERSSRSHCLVCRTYMFLFLYFMIFFFLDQLSNFHFSEKKKKENLIFIVRDGHLQIILDVPSVGGRLMLVDMAGSENIEAAGQTGLEAKMQVNFFFSLCK